MIREVRVQNFKSLKDVSVALGRRTVIVGPNMSGKSNFVSLFRFLRQMVLPAPGVHGLANAISSFGGFQEIAWRGGDSNLITITLTGDWSSIGGESSSQWKYLLEIIGSREGGVTIQNELLAMLGPNGSVDVIRRDPALGRRIIRSINGEKLTEVPDTSRSGLEFEIPDWEGNKIRQLFASFRFYNLVPQAMKQANATSAAPALGEHGENLSSWLMMLQTRYDIESFEKISQAARDVLPDLAKIMTWPTAQSTVFIASMERHLKTAIPVWQMSDGELCFIALLSLIFSPRDLGAPLHCVEEPENHLHPRLLTTLVELHKQRLDEIGEAAAQTIVSTHSLQLVDKVTLEDLIVFEKREGATTCLRPSERTELRELLTREEMGLGELYYSGALGSA